MGNSLIIDGLKEAVRHARGDSSRATSRVVFVDHPLDVRAIRTKLGLTQAAFADKFGFSLASVRNWEQHRRSPQGTQKVLLKIIDAIPEEVERVLNAA